MPIHILKFFKEIKALHGIFLKFDLNITRIIENKSKNKQQYYFYINYKTY